LLALTEKNVLTWINRLKQEHPDRYFPPSSVQLTIPRKPLHPLMLLAHGREFTDPVVAAHKWQWEDIPDLAMFKGGWLYIAPLLKARPPELDRHIPAYRTTVTNMMILKSDFIWHASFAGEEGLRKVANAGNVLVILWVLAGGPALARFLRWPEFPDIILKCVLCAGCIDVFLALWERHPQGDGFWDWFLISRVENVGNYALVKAVRALGLPIRARVDAAIKSGDLDYLQEALCFDLERDPLVLVRATATERLDMVYLLLDHGFEWPTLFEIPPSYFVSCVNCGFDPFARRNDGRMLCQFLMSNPEVVRSLDRIVSPEMRAAIKQECQRWSLFSVIRKKF
jgi:hypothetical protein